jgi:excisionase family DNA binding protein
MDTAVPAPIAVSVEQAAKLAGVSRALAYREIAAGKLKASKLGGRTVVRIADVEAWIAAGTLN